jgi:hypothetical protein
MNGSNNCVHVHVDVIAIPKAAVGGENEIFNEENLPPDGSR